MKTIVWRDDDIAVDTRGKKLDQFKEVQALFDKYKVPHTIAVICRDIEKNTELIEFINSNGLIVPEFHCLDHIRYSDNHNLVVSQFTDGLEIFERLFDRPPRIFFPPWNEVDAFVEQMAFQFGMKTSVQKVSLGQYIRVDGEVEESVINFHYWSEKDRGLLETALKIYDARRKKV